MKRLAASLASALLAAEAAAAETPEAMLARIEPGAGRQAASEVLAGLLRDPRSAALITRHPDMVLGWAEDFWVDAMLRAPTLPGEPWRVHDLRRPQPPHRSGGCRPAAPPAGAQGLGPDDFDGPGRRYWQTDGPVLTASGVRASRIATRAVFGDLRLHLEFRMPSPVQGYGQYRGNSGVFLLGAYEVQLLDGWRNPTYADGALGALYGQSPPRVNAALPPGVWQCLDVEFTAPRLQDGRVAEPARATVRINGLLVQRDRAFLGPTVFAQVASYDRAVTTGPITLQDHGDAGGRVSFRNIWVVAR